MIGAGLQAVPCRVAGESGPRGAAAGKRRSSCLALVCSLVFYFLAMPVCFGQEAKEGPGHAIRTESPRETFSSFLSLSRALEEALLEYRENRTERLRAKIARIGDDFLSLIDLSEIPKAARRKQGIETGALLLDIFGRVDMPHPDAAPGTGPYAGAGRPVKWRVPGTPIEIARIEQGRLEGEFLFSARTVERAPLFYREIHDLPLKSRLPIRSWTEYLPQLTGPMIPAGLVAALPESFKRNVFGTPVWKVLAVLVLTGVALLLVAVCSRLFAGTTDDDSPLAILRRTIAPVLIVAATSLLQDFAAAELNVTGSFAAAFASLATLLKYFALAWIFWLLVRMVAEFVVLSPKIPDQSLDANLLRLGARVAGLVGAAAIVAYAANSLGLPVLSIVAGLGIGGLAVALAVRPTLENLIGGLILYTDRPVRVGDYCQFDKFEGTIEKIGVRSTQIRALDRTVISIPNAKFADMEIVNWAHCDKMLIHAVIGLRYETTPDQLRHVLAKLREMLVAHPKVDTKKVRVSFVGFGASSLDVDIRVYALTRERNEFHAIREDILLRAGDIVTESGTAFAFPSQTVYFGRDEGIDHNLGVRAARTVATWRKDGALPFPQMSQARVDEIADSLDYPPQGSVSSIAQDIPEAVSSERLSIEPVDDSDTETDAAQEPAEARGQNGKQSRKSRKT